MVIINPLLEESRGSGFRQPATRLVKDSRIDSTANTVGERSHDSLARRLAGDFPLHSISELGRTIAAAEQELWPRKDPINILDRARERLREGLVG